MKVEQYLKRIDFSARPQPDFANLVRLQQKHMLAIPFENLDVLRGIPILPDVEKIYDKVVEQNRGGFCYELNGLFHWLLTSLGYKTHLISATVQGSEGQWSPEGSHASILVYLDQPYLVDVGFGDSFRQPLPLTGEEQTDPSGTYRITEMDNGQLNLQQKTDKGWRTQFRFTTQERTLESFAEMCHYNQTSPHSHFTQRRIVTIATRDGRITLSDDSLTTTYPEGKKKQDIHESDVEQLLERYFNILI